MSRRLRRWQSAALQALALVARPVRRAQGRGGVVIEPYRGYGSERKVFLIGRVFRQTHADGAAGLHDLRAHLRDIGRRIRRRAMPGVSVIARFGGRDTRVATDRDGYFRVHLDLDACPTGGRAGWHRMHLTLEVDPPVEAEGSVFIPPATARFAVISDIDDTVMHTGVANKVAMLWRLFVASADDRVAFPGVAAFYHALHEGAGGHQTNPILYVSRAPWGTYDMLTLFFRKHRIPVGPEMFLREWGLSWRHPWPRRAEDHKRELIGNMMALYPDLPFVLIGDSGQHDPEVYAQAVREHPGRIKAVYIRDVSRGAARAGEVAALRDAVEAAGSSLVLAADSVAMARHAARIGLVSEATITAVAEERDDASPKPPATDRRSHATGRRSAT